MNLNDNDDNTNGTCQRNGIDSSVSTVVVDVAER